MKSTYSAIITYLESQQSANPKVSVVISITPKITTFFHVDLWGWSLLEYYVAKVTISDHVFFGLTSKFRGKHKNILHGKKYTPFMGIHTSCNSKQ